jgi:hypothetical protein
MKVKNTVLFFAAVFLILTFLLSCNAMSQNQVKIKLYQPPSNMLNASSLWKVNLSNTSGKQMKIFLQGYVDEKKDGRIVEGKTNVFILPADSKDYSYPDFRDNGNVIWKKSDYEEAITKTGNAPAGTYTICITAKSESGEIVGMEKCIPQVISLKAETKVSIEDSVIASPYVLNPCLRYISQLDTSSNPLPHLDRISSCQTTTTSWVLGGNTISTGTIPFIATCNCEPLIFGTAGYERMRISALGKVGIGTNAPTEHLHIEGQDPTIRLKDIYTNSGSPMTNDLHIVAANGCGRIISDNSIALFLDGQNQNNNAYFSIRTHNNYFATDAPELFRVDPSGMIVRASSNESFAGYFENNGGSGKGIYIKGGAGTNAGDEYALLKIDRYSSGSAPMTLFQVNGKSGITYAREIVVTLDAFPDYVFEDGYNLKSIEELKDYILINKHLPGFPSANEIKSNGLNLNKINVCIIEKIEEIILYIIQQSKKNDSFQKKNQELLKKINYLEKENIESKKRLDDLEKKLISIRN